MEDEKRNRVNNINNIDNDFITEEQVIIEEHILKEDGRTIVKKYERGKFLGKGGFAMCYELRCLDTNKLFAAKILDKKNLANSRSKKKLINEIKLHKKLHHTNIVNFQHFFEDKEQVYILLELCSNQTLNELIKRRKRITEIEVQCYMIQILKALKYIHLHKIIHRDIKLGNCFLTNKLELKLGDFGLAAKLEYEGQRRRTICGTPNYIAPEILEKKNGHSFEVDIWSLGVLCYTLLYGKPPFESNDVKNTYKKIKINNYNFPENIKVHPTAKRLISLILNLDPAKRPSIDQILEHDFFKIFNSVPLLLPNSTLACPPSKKYLVQYMQKDGGMSYSNLNLKTYIQGESQIANFQNKKNADQSGSLSNSDDNENQDKVESPEKENKEESLKKNTFHHLDINNIIKSEYLKSYGKVSKYIDFSTKFGIIYIIKNKCVGVCFNDFTNIVKNFNLKRHEIQKFQYIYFEKNSKNQANFDEEGFESFIQAKIGPNDVIKKFEIFKQVLIKYSKDIKEHIVEEDSQVSGHNNKNDYTTLHQSQINIVFMKKFLKTNNTIIFRLSNKIMQIVFADKTEMIFSTEGSDFIYKNQEGGESYLNILSVLNSEDEEMIERIKMSKNLLMIFVKNHKIKKKMS